MMMNRICHSCCLGMLIASLSLASPWPISAGVYYDLGRPVVGAWLGVVGLAWDPVLEKNLLWAQEASQDGAVLFALDLETGAVLEEHDAPAREIGRVLVAANDVLYFPTYSGLNHPGNELLRFDPRRRGASDRSPPQPGCRWYRLGKRRQSADRLPFWSP